MTSLLTFSLLHCIKQIDSMLPCVCPVIETYTTGRLEDSGRQNDEKMSRKTGKARSCKTFFRHSAVLSLPAVPLHKVSIRSQTTSRCGKTDISDILA